MGCRTDFTHNYSNKHDGNNRIVHLPNLEDPFTAYPTLAINHMPFPIGVALLMGVLGASMSTANGGLLAISSVISRNIIQRNIMRRVLKREGMGDKKLLMTTRIFTIPMMAAAIHSRISPSTTGHIPCLGV